MLIEQQQREPRVRFQHPIRVVTLEGQPRVIRTLTANVSRDGLFLRMPEPLPPGMKVALSLEAGGRALALAQAEVVWTGEDQTEVTERFPGCGVRFTEFMHPRAEELVRYLVRNLDKGKPLMLAPPERRWARWLPFAGGGALVACAALAALVFWGPSDAEVVEEEPAPSVELIAAAPIVHPVAPAPAPEIAKVEVAPVAPAAELEKVEVAESPEPVKAEPEPAPVPPSPAEAAKPVAAPLDSARGERELPLPAKRGEGRGEGPTARKADQKGEVKLPSGAAAKLRWEITGTELRLTPELANGAQLTRAFVLSGPPRAVFDLSGASPARSDVAPGSPPYASAVRLGKQPGGTRVVIDLDSAPRRTSQRDGSLVLSF